jgi:hypothetical protein
MHLIARHDAIQATIDRAAEFAGEAKAALGVFADTPVRRA